METEPVFCPRCGDETFIVTSKDKVPDAYCDTCMIIYRIDNGNVIKKSTYKSRRKK